MSDCCDTSSEKAFDVAVIGAGSAGFSAAITAAEKGARVALIGNDTIGGTCVNVGCVPSKVLIRAVESLHGAAAAKRFDGIEASASVTDWSALIAQKQALVDELRQVKYIDVLQSYNTISYLEGIATFTENGALSVDRKLLNADKIIIATGSHPHVPAIPGIDTVPYLTSTTALELDQLPASLLVIGAGYIGVEIAQIFARAGVEVTIVMMPAVVFSDPQVASVGLTQAEAINNGFEVRTSTLTLDNVPRALAARDTRGLIKLIADGKTNKLLGAHILAPDGADSIQTAAVAIKAGMTYHQLGEMIFPYLTTVEGLKLAAQTFDMDVKKLSCCAG